MGIDGAGIAFLIVNVVELFFLIIVLKKYLNISPMNIFKTAYFPSMFIGLILAISSLFLRQFSESWLGLFLSVSAFEIIYIFLSYKTGIFGETEKNILLQLLTRVKKLVR